MKRRFFAVGVFAALALLCAPAPAAHADVNDFTVTAFSADETLTRADRQGTLHIVEHIEVDFTDNNHGILRAIPNNYKKHRLQLHVNKVSSASRAPVQYTTYTQSGNTVLKIGDPDRTVTGLQEYTIDYTLRNVVTFYKDHDELYWDINGDDWWQQFDHVSVRLHLPDGLKQNRTPVCYTGSFGSLAEDCTIASGDTAIAAATTKPLASRQTLSLVAGFDKGYFQPSTWQDTLGEYAKDIIAFTAGLLLAAVPAWLLWFRRGRDPKGTGVIVPQYGPPEGLGPIEVGTLIDFRTDNRDITAAIIDLAIRRYITIVEEKQERKLRRDTTIYLLRLEKQGFGELNEFERTIMTGLFGGAEVGTEVSMASKKYKMADTATKLRTTVRESLVTRGYFRSHPVNFRLLAQGALVVLAIIIAGVLSNAFGAGLGFWLGVIPGAILAAIFLALLSARTEKGVAAKEEIEGLRMYLQVAEKDRLRLLQSPDARYAANSARAPKHSVHLFEKLLPYAMVLGVEQAWAKQFEHIYTKPPEWYSGNWGTFSVLYLTSSLSGGVGQAINSAFTPPSSSSGSGFGGGGAGGGGGGGGGGGW